MRTRNIIILLCVVLGSFLSLVGVILFMHFQALKSNQPSENKPVACTLDAKLCSDGSYVGRVAPDCAFAACPTNTTWKWFIDEDQAIQFQYPEELTTSYIFTDPQNWPPTITLSGGPLSCEGKATREVDNRRYCVTKTSEGAAGTIYVSYVYTTMRANELLTINFTLRYPQCGNYDEDKRILCENERESFDLDAVIDRIVLSIEATPEGK